MRNFLDIYDNFPCLVFMGATVLCLLLIPVSECWSAQRSLVWDPPKNARSSDLIGYRVFCRPEGQTFNYDRPAWEGKETRCAISGLSDDVTYYFVVRAVDKYGRLSPNSNEVPHMLTGLKIEGPGWIDENSFGYYTARAQFKLGTDQPATQSTRWTIDSPFGNIELRRNEDLKEWLMVLSTLEVPLKQKMTIEAEFTFDNEKAFDKKDVWVVDGENREDSDADGMPNWWESKYHLDPDADDSQLDMDGDGLSNQKEYQEGTDPTRSDTDFDGHADGWEVARGFDPVDLDSTAGLPLLESEMVQLNHEWKRVALSKPFSDPIVVAGPLTYEGRQAALVRVRDIDETGFDIRVQEWDYLDGAHATEQSGYLVVERGHHVLPDGTRVEAGSFEAGSTDDFVDVVFESRFSVVPIVVTSVSSYKGADAVSCRIRNPGRQGFELCLQEEEGNRGSHVGERIDYVAWEPSVGSIDGLSFEVRGIEQGVTDLPSSLAFDNPFGSAPVFIADIQTYNGSDPVNVRLIEIDKRGATLFLDEERSLDEETDHVPEGLGYMSFSWN